MSVILKRFPLHSVSTFLARPSIVKTRDRITNFKPVRFVLNVLDDYASVIKDAAEDSRARPWRSVAISLGLLTAYLAYRRNPTELSFRDHWLDANNDLIQVPVRSRNPAAEEFLVEVGRLRNQGRLEYQNWGLAAVVLRRDFDKGCDLYEARCKYLKVPLERLWDTVVDVGVWGRWWRMERAMRDYDIHPE
ncbi:mitochondrial import inner membrane translocase subunit Tim29-like [Paramacrobiotus metropolitanus]|uniref:mitochondrial import inner membrane translocase subunit Tim29-like n=1 Tax=Paramacrobiotus metropolitanus TaxID=2943436 RepID=UPI0024456866|nr:mitochondrial import inner membrane translocase subunit Tim29-like [Paramacrobiotus metropolitanus]